VDLRPLRVFLMQLRNELRIQRSDLVICFVSDSEIAEMNQFFRKKAGPTDVLSFPRATEKNDGQKRSMRMKPKSSALSDRPYLGDIAISPETARRYAKKHGRSVRDELKVLMLHGVLHLLGYDHETDRGEMDRIEQRLRRRFGLA
jgi:probable rRNA maturation factor